MNIKSIIELTEQLAQLGFHDLLSPLVKRMCFKPKRFIVGYQVEKGGNIIRCQLQFEEDSQAATRYSFSCYDAFFQPAQSFEGNIGGVDITLLTKRMSEIDWVSAFDVAERKNGLPSEKGTFENELKVAAVIDDLVALQSSNEGKAVAINLKQKYWAGIPGQDGSSVIETTFRSKAEISQRFYIVNGQPPISLDEAYRYLQNRWLEKEMLAQRRQTQTANDESTEASGYGTGLLKKRRRRKPADKSKAG